MAIVTLSTKPTNEKLKEEVIKLLKEKKLAQQSKK